MIGKEEVLGFAREVGLDPNVVEKDYVLGWMLAGISSHSRTQDTWLFKGGTCLKKCYFETYRFSEDLDFTLLDSSCVDEAVLRQIFSEITQWVHDQSGIELPESERAFEAYVNPRGKKSAQGRIGYRGPMQRQASLPRIRFDLTDDERIVLKGERRRAHHPYSDEPEGGIAVLAYCFEELFAEKLRALAERQRPRDLYDVVHLYRRAVDLNRTSFRTTLAAKCEFKDIPVPTIEGLFSSPLHAELREDWDQMLAHQLAALPPFESSWNELPSVFAWLAREDVVPRRFAISSLGADIDAAWRAPAMAHSWRADGIAAPLEIVRFAAANQLCVDLEYRDEQGRVGSRLIEPYSLRRTKAGDILLYAVRSDNGQDRSYRVERILAARATSKSFRPRYEVELSLAAPLKVAEISRPARTWSPSVRPSRTSTRTKPYSRGFGQPRYIFQCVSCGKRFEHSRYDSTLREHKTRSGYPCSSRIGSFITTKY